MEKKFLSFGKNFRFSKEKKNLEKKIDYFKSKIKTDGVRHISRNDLFLYCKRSEKIMLEIFHNPMSNICKKVQLIHKPSDWKSMGDNKKCKIIRLKIFVHSYCDGQTQI